METSWRHFVQALAVFHLGGQALGSAMVDLLYGHESFSGRLAQTWYESVEDCPANPYFPGGHQSVHYREGPFISLPPDHPGVAFAYGHGLTTTTLTTEAPILVGQTVKITVKNSGPLPGAHVVLITAKMPMDDPRPCRITLGFEKVELAPGQSRQVSVALDLSRLSFHSHDGRFIQTPGGDYRLMVNDHPLVLKLAGPNCEQDSLRLLQKNKLYAPHPSFIDDSLFQALLGRTLPPLSSKKAPPFDEGDALETITSSLRGKIIFWIIRTISLTAVSGSLHTRRMVSAMMMELPIRSLGLMGGPWMTARRVRGLLRVLNGKLLEGLMAFVLNKKSK